MMKYIFSVLIALLSWPVVAQQSQAKAVLDKAAEAFRKAGGIQAEFSVKYYDNGQFAGTSSGVIRLKGERFQLKTPEAATWFDGKTQWSYLESSEEVNITTPTQEELQSINPYTLLYLYQKGFSYKLGSVKSFGGKSVEEVILTATNRKQDLASIILYVSPDTYQPIFILLQQRGGKNRSEITITGYKTGLNYPDADFAFDRKQYPNAEIIDLR
ncbi:LolA-like putative outer membrane lipoprotein chaperone [Bacteroides sp.]|uniref:LolA-like putative outer membrane lipoprotein chaperone n=1 Tax=Bacteroides sp. TaxID=29523 RepID=UPI002630270E|nr:LolA-like putative outer membrane lipoprotein chaperone [Bacteroides sp.]MDD3036789.1 LolA-like putative outer membrane lipoprotein chaperone [Bacteroides sp.]